MRKGIQKIFADVVQTYELINHVLTFGFDIHWRKKIALDLSSFKADSEKLTTPSKITIIFPRIEEGRKGSLLNPIKNKRIAAKLLFDNISQKLTETVILYDRFPPSVPPVQGCPVESVFH